MGILAQITEGLQNTSSQADKAELKENQKSRQEFMIGPKGQRIEVRPYDWVYVKDGLPEIKDTRMRACYVCFSNGKTAGAYYTGSLINTWLSQQDTHIALNEQDIVAWRYQIPA